MQMQRGKHFCCQNQVGTLIALLAEEGEDWNGKFGSISTSYEECRADTCGFYLCTLPQVYSLFGFDDSEVDTVLWVNVMNQFRKGVLGLQLFNAEAKKWGQAHTWGAWVFVQYIY